MKKLLSILGSLSIVGSSAITVVACGDTNQKENKKELVELSSVISVFNLGEIKTTADLPSETEIITKIKLIEENKNLNEKEIKVNNIGATEATITVNENSTVYEQGTLKVNYTTSKEEEPKQLPTLVELIKIANLEKIRTKNEIPTSAEILIAIAKKNNGLSLQENELEIKINPITNQATITVNENSTVYEQGSITVTYEIMSEEEKENETNQEIINMATDRAKSMIIAQNYGFNHNLTYASMTLNNDTTNYDTFFNNDSVTNLLNNANQNSNLLVEQQVTALVNNPQANTEPIVDVIKSIIKSLNIFDFSLSSILQFISTMLNGMSINLDEILENIEDQFNDFINNNSEIKIIKPILNGLINGSDLTKYANLTVSNFYATVVSNFVNALGYGIDEYYQEIDFTNAKQLEIATNYFVDFIKTGKIFKFNFGFNPEKIIQSLVSSFAIMNTVLAIYQTPEVDYNTKLSRNRDRSQYLFSNTQNNDTFVYTQGRKIVKNFNIDLKGLKINQFIDNLNYYFGGNQTSFPYRLQKLNYVLLFQGKSRLLTNYGSPIFDFVIDTITGLIVPNNLAGASFIKSGLRTLILTSLIEPLVNNKILKLTNIFKNDIVWNFIKGLIEKSLPNIDEEDVQYVIEKIQEFLGGNPFTAILTFDLRPILNLLATIMPEKIMDSIMNAFNDIFGDDEINLVNLIEKLDLNNVIKLVEKIIPSIDQSQKMLHYVDQITNDGQAFNVEEEKQTFANSNQLKSLNLIIEFDTNTVKNLANNQKLKYQIVVERTTANQKFDFTKMTKVI